MKAIITGANGTLGKVLQKLLKKNGYQVVKWDRSKIAINNYKQMENFVKKEAPDLFFHLAIASKPTGLDNESWLVNYEWTSELAWLTRQLGIPFVFTSTAMVFSDNALGPFTPDSQPDAQEGYGYEKRRAEERVFSQNPNARIVRLGWQIGEEAGSNNMIDFFETKQKEEGQVFASTRWLPACSFLEDTAAGLFKVTSMAAGLYLLNANPKWNFFQIATALNKKHGNKWKITANEDFVFDQRMIDTRLKIPDLDSQLEL